MKRPYRDVLVWLANIQPPDDFPAKRAIAAVIGNIRSGPQIGRPMGGTLR